METFLRFARVFCMVSLLFSIVSTSALAAENGGVQGKDEVDQILDSYKERLNPSDYNFTNEDEFNKAGLGIAIPIYSMNINKVAKNTKNLASKLIDLGLVEYGIEVNGEMLTRMTLKKNGDSYERFGFGGDGEALAKGLMTFPKEEQTNVKLVKFGPAEFLSAEIDNQHWLVYISKRPIDSFESYKMYKAEEIAPKLQLLANGMNASKGKDGGFGIEVPVKNNNTKYLLVLIGIITLLSFFSIRFYKKKLRT